MSDDGGPAFPIHSRWITQGLSLRDYFAARAPAVVFDGLQDNPGLELCRETLGLPKDTPWIPNIHWPRLVAKIAYRYADAMLEARKAPPAG
jgi:hypothetical protein